MMLTVWLTAFGFSGQTFLVTVWRPSVYRTCLLGFGEPCDLPTITQWSTAKADTDWRPLWSSVVLLSPEGFDLVDKIVSEKVATACSGCVPEDTAVPPTCGWAAPVYACLVEKNADFTHSALKAVSVPEAKTHRLGKYFALGYNSKDPNAISAGSLWCCCSPVLGNT